MNGIKHENIRMNLISKAKYTFRRSFEKRDGKKKRIKKRRKALPLRAPQKI